MGEPDIRRLQKMVTKKGAIYLSYVNTVFRHAIYISDDRVSLEFINGFVACRKLK
jgi:hypothetical protein